jgi:RNA polymerase sigma factor (sigma-70 family)
LSADVDWKSLVFESDWLQKLDQLAAKRFSAGGLAEEASSYVIEQMSADNWSKLDSFKGNCKPETFLHTVTANYLEEFSRKRFGRPRPPEWLKRQGELWVQVWKLVCLERQMIQSVIDHLCCKSLREPGAIQHIVVTVKARLPWCGESTREILLDKHDNDDSDYDPADHIVHEQTPDDELTEDAFSDLLLMISSLFLEKLDGDHFSDSRRASSNALAGKHYQSLQALKQNIELTDEERLLLRMVFQDGMKKSVVAKSLGMQEHLPGRILKRALAKISQAFHEVGIDMEEVRKLSLDTP